MIKDAITVDGVIEFLNDWLKSDPEAVANLMAARVPCNRATAKHPSIQVSAMPELNPPAVLYAVGTLGFINGLFGTIEPGDQGPTGHGLITMLVDENERPLKFVRTEQAAEFAETEAGEPVDVTPKKKPACDCTSPEGCR